jgi:hypothetical protein
MDWTYPTTPDDRRAEGISEMARRVVDEIGDSHLPGTRFTYDAREMLRATREIEAAVRGGGELWVGFQNASKLDHEAARYEDLTASGADVIAFGTGRPGIAPAVRLRWIQLEPSSVRLENQWFLVTTDPEPIAFVSWEVSDPALFGVGGISAPDKQFVGFVTDDGRVIAALVSYLEAAAMAADPR